jgi:Sec7-like guanine-nucleotide exchange factor
MIGESNPVFVKIDKYKEILSIVEVINKKVVSVKQLLADLEQLRTKEEEEVRLWEKNMDEITRKLGSMQEELTK